MKKYLPIFLMFLMLWAATAFANTCVFVGGSHNWSAAAAWTGCGGVIPTATDDVLVGTGTGGSTTGTLTVDGSAGTPSLARGVDFTSFTGTLNGSGVLNVGDLGGSGAGVFKLVSGMTFSFGGGTINFVSTTGTTQITTATKSMPIVVYNGAGGTWQQQDAYTSTKLQTLTAGTEDMNNFNMTLSGGYTSLTGSTRVLKMGSGTLDMSAGTSAWTVGTLASGLNINAGTSTLKTGWAGTTDNFGDQAYNAIIGTVGTSNPTATLNGNFTAATYSVSTNSSQTLVWELGGNPTFTTSLTLNGNGAGQKIFVRSTVRGTQRTITAASVTSQYTAWQDIVGAGAFGWNISAITGNSEDCGNNYGITFTSQITAYMKTGTTHNWGDAIWFTTSGGSSAARVPMCQDTARIDANSITAGSVTINGNILRLGNVDWTGVTNNPTWAKTNATALELYGSVTMNAGMTSNGVTNGTTFANSGRSVTLNTIGQTWGNPMTIDAGSGTVQLASSVTASNTFTMTSGTLDLNSNNYTGNTTITINGGTIDLSAQLAATGAVSVTGGTILNTGSSCELKSGTTMALSGGTATIKKITAGTTFTQSGTSSLTIPGNGSMTWGTGSNLTLTPNSESLVIQGLPTFTGSSLSIVGNSHTFGN